LTELIQKPRHIAGLDGLRAISVVSVIGLHTLQRLSLSHHVPWWMLAVSNGALGVFIFFVISGYLITTLLLREQGKAGRISLKSFYLRRAFRILPPLYVYIAVIAVLGALRLIPGVNTREIVTALLFLRNYAHGVSLWAFEHLWSLCIEEQFYLLWPSILVFCLLRRREGAGKALAAKIALAVIVVEPIVRVVWFRLPNVTHNSGMIHLNCDGLMFGALAALTQGTKHFEALYRRVTRWPWLLPVLLFGVSGASGVRFQNYWNFPLGWTIDGALAMFWMVWLTRNPETTMGRALSLGWVMWIGRLSYSLYIWQTLFTHHENVTIAGDAWWMWPPLSWPCILGLAVVSYYVVEQPSLRLRDVFLTRMRWHEL